MNIKAASLTRNKRLPSWKRAMKPRSRRYAKPSATISTIIRSPIPKPARKVFCLSAAVGLRDGADHKALKTRAWGRFTHAGCYTTTITNPKLFRNYLLEQLTLLYQDYGAHISVELSQHEIPILT